MNRYALILILILGFAGISFSQSPAAINYQAVARDGSGNLLNSSSLTVRIGVYSGAGGTVLEYEETHSVTTNAYGQFSLQIGDGTPVNGTFSGIDWANDENHLKVEVDDGNGYVDLGTNQLVSVPYAMHASTSDEAANVKWMSSSNDIYYNSGYVGIGTSSPGAGLSLESSAGYGSAVALDNTGGGEEWRLTSWTDGTFRLVKASGSTFSPIVVEPNDGKVGIGTSSPDHQLHVHTSSGLSYIRVSDNTTGVTSGLRMGLSGSGNAYIINDESLKSLSLGTSGTTQIRINADGYMGVNELSPDMMVHIKQDVANKGLRFEHQSTTDYWDNGIGTTTKNFKFYYNNLFRADISSTDGSYTQSSDRRLKKEILPLESVTAKIEQLQPYSYHYIDNTDSDPRSIGFIAQDVEAIFPDLVRETDDGYKGLVYDGFAVISIKAIQELNDKVNSMKQEIDMLMELLENK